MRKKTIFLTFILSIGLLLSNNIYATANIQTNYSTKLFSINIGAGDGKIAYTPDVPGVEKCGPESFSISSDGTFFILDTIDNQVEIFDSKGSYLSTVNLPDEKGQFFDIEASYNNSFVVLNYNGEIFQYEDGKLINQYKYEMKENESILYGLAKDKFDKVVFRSLKDGTDNDFFSGAKKDSYDGYIVKSSEKSMILTSDEQKINIDYSYTCAGAYPLLFTDNGERLIEENEALIGDGIYVETRVTKYKNGQKLGTALALPIKNNYDVKVPHKFINAAKDSKVYQMILKKNSVDIYQLDFSKENRSNINSNLVESIKPQNINAPNTSVVPMAMVDRLTAWSNAVNMVNYTWTYDPSTMKTPVTSTKKPPTQLAKLTTKTSVKGIPYCWGGANGDVAACGLSSFSSALSSGSTAGNINTSSPSWVSGTAGVDCSGFISVAYRLNRHYGTKELADPNNNLFTHVSWNFISKGDIADRTDHVWMYDYTLYDSSGNIVGYSTLESTFSGSGGEKAKYHSRKLSDAQTYTPFTKK